MERCICDISKSYTFLCWRHIDWVVTVHSEWVVTEYQTKPNFQWKVVLQPSPRNMSLIDFILFSEIGESILKMVKNWKTGACKIMEKVVEILWVLCERSEKGWIWWYNNGKQIFFKFFYFGGSFCILQIEIFNKSAKIIGKFSWNFPLLGMKNDPLNKK